MKTKLSELLGRYVLITGITLGSLLLSQESSADDIYKAVRGPTSWQLDSRVTFAKNEQISQKARTANGNIILKYWNGDEFGWWGFLNLPYKSIDAESGSSAGLGDILLGGGPIGRIQIGKSNDLHWISYVGLALPTGDDESEPVLGNGRTDIKIGLTGTYLAKDKRYEVDGIVERNLTGKNDSGVNPPDETYLGLLGGGEIAENLRFATGPTYRIKNNGDYRVDWKAALKYTVSPRLHFELAGERTIDGHDIPETTGVGLYMRYNF